MKSGKLSQAKVARQLGVSRATVSEWAKKVQVEAQQIRKHDQWKSVRILGLDGAYVLGRGEKQPVLVVVDLGSGEPITVGYVNEYDPQAIIRWLRPLVQRHGISVIVTDDLFSYSVVVKKLQLGHQVCQFHARRWLGRTLKELQEHLPKEWLWMLDEVRQLLEVLHPQGSQRLYALWKQLPGRRAGQNKPLSALEQLRDLLLRLSESWLPPISTN